MNPRQPPTYVAEDGKVDRHGEMTGAITFNMILTMVPVSAWSFFIGPWLLHEQVTLIVVIAIAMALILPLIWVYPSRRLWAWFSAWAKF